jgi:hypothetical protein
MEISSDGLAAKVGPTTSAIGGSLGGLLLLALIVSAVAIALLVRKKRASERVDGDNSELDNGIVETMTTFGINENYVSQEGFSGEGHCDAVGGEAHNIPDES